MTCDAEIVIKGPITKLITISSQKETNKRVIPRLKFGLASGRAKSGMLKKKERKRERERERERRGEEKEKKKRRKREKKRIISVFFICCF